MDPAITPLIAASIGLVGAVIGGLSGIAGGILAGRRQANLEREKWRQTRKDDIERETRAAVAELTRKMAAAIQEMLWFTSKAANNPKELTRQAVSDYDNEIKERLPDILGSLCVVSALDTDIANRISPIMGEIYSVDASIAAVCRNLDSTPESSIESLAQLFYTRVNRLHSELVQRVSGIVGLTDLEETFSARVTRT